MSAGEALLLDGHLIRLAVPLQLGHKLARRAIAEGEAVTKYGCPMGHAMAANRPWGPRPPAQYP